MSLINHITTRDKDIQLGQLYTYIFGGNGIFLHGQREHMHVTMPYVRCEVKELQNVVPDFKLALPPVPRSLVNAMWVTANHWAEQGLETLFHLTWSPISIYNDGWDLIEPPQERSGGNVRPLEDGAGSSHERAIIEVHSHHSMAARFTGTDNRDETGFRLYAVLGRLDSRPEIRMRVGLYGHFWEIPANFVMDLPFGLIDCVTREAFGEETAA